MCVLKNSFVCCDYLCLLCTQGQVKKLIETGLFIHLYNYFGHKGRLCTQGQGKKLIETGLFIHLYKYFGHKGRLCTQGQGKKLIETGLS